MLSISVVICCYNSARLLPTTLHYLSRQQVPPELEWEIVIIDNNSTDDSKEIAERLWGKISSVPIRIIHENKQGAGFARFRGLKEAQHDLVCFIDDDNWPYPDYLKLASEIMSEKSQVGALGGFNEAACESDPPSWYERFAWSYAVGKQAEQAGDVTESRGFLFGAGLVVRKLAWQQVLDTTGLKSLLSIGRQGKKIAGGGEDTEICFAVKQAGWRLWYDPRFKIYHFLPTHRLRWRYLCQLHRGFGKSTIQFDSYYLIKKPPKNLKEYLVQTWQYQALFTAKQLLGQLFRLVLELQFLKEGEERILGLHNKIGRLTELLKWRRQYNVAIDDTRKRFKKFG